MNPFRKIAPQICAVREAFFVAGDDVGVLVFEKRKKYFLGGGVQKHDVAPHVGCTGLSTSVHNFVQALFAIVDQGQDRCA